MKDGTKFKGNIVDYFVGKYMDKTVFKVEFYHSSFFLFIAAFKTSSDGLSKLLYLLASHQDVQDKLRESILVDGIDSTYLIWVINEALRLIPPSHIGCTRALSRDSETKFGKVPKDTVLSAHAWTIHRWPDYWEQDANEFKPERWSKSGTFH